MLCAGTLGLVTVVAMVGCAGASRGQHYTEVFSSSEDGQHVLVRARRSAEVCKYKKGEWSPCDTMVMLVTREDTLKEKHSGPGCDKLRTITKNCKDKEEREGGICVFEKPKNVAWSKCKDAGVRQRVLHLVREKGDAAGCPKEKILSKKCKEDKKNKKHEGGHAADKCGFGGWTEWSECENNKKQRKREILKGKERKICLKSSAESAAC